MKIKLKTILVLCIFAVNTAHAQYIKLFDFAGQSNGREPSGYLISDNTHLYGTTAFGGANGVGTIFKIKKDGTGYTKLLDFAGESNGAEPLGSLYFDGNFLYGMTSKGGLNNMGTVFKIKSDGTGYTKLLDFDGEYNGQFPDRNSFISDGTFLYGMTEFGGIQGVGTIFKIRPDGSDYSKLHDFDGLGGGSYSRGNLILVGNSLYGTTCNGGANGLGSMFKINKDGTGFSILLDFAGESNGANPESYLIFVDSAFYGLTAGGGLYNFGTFFKVNIDGSGYTKLMDFDGVNKGSYPTGYLIKIGTSFYGTTGSGGTNDYGTLFKINHDGTGYTKLMNFVTISEGVNPTGTLVADSTALYGMTGWGGNSRFGTIFKYQICTPPSNNVTISNNTLTAEEIGATYQWIDCDNGNAPINGATSRNFTPAVSGKYAVMITKNGCLATSSCITVTTTSILKNNFISDLTLYPNPSSDEITIQSANFKKTEVTIIVKNSIGQESIRKTFIADSELSLTLDGEAGVYFVEVITKDYRTIFKVIRK